MGEGASTTRGGYDPLCVLELKNIFTLVRPLGCCWKSVMTTKWLSHHGDPLEGLLRAANQQKKAGLKLFSIAEMNIWKKTRTYVVYFDQLSGACSTC